MIRGSPRKPINWLARVDPTSGVIDVSMRGDHRMSVAQLFRAHDARLALLHQQQRSATAQHRGLAAAREAAKIKPYGPRRKP